MKKQDSPASIPQNMSESFYTHLNTDYISHFLKTFKIGFYKELNHRKLLTEEELDILLNQQR